MYPISMSSAWGARRASSRRTGSMSSSRLVTGGIQLSVVAERDPARAQQVGLLGHELRERPLDGLAVDIAPSRRGEDGEVGAQVTQDSAPVPRRVLPEDATLRRLDQIGQRRAVASGALV